MKKFGLTLKMKNLIKLYQSDSTLFPVLFLIISIQSYKLLSLNILYFFGSKLKTAISCLCSINESKFSMKVSCLLNDEYNKYHTIHLLSSSPYVLQYVQLHSVFVDC